MNNDLTVGKPSSVLWRFCLPLFGSIIFQQMYNIADSFVAGKFIGEDALAAVGNSYEITLIFIAIAFGSNVGCSVIVSQLFGAKKYETLKTAVYTTLIASGVLCALLMLGGLMFGTELLYMIHTPENIFADSLAYLKIYIYGIPFIFLYNISTAIFSALGDSRTPFIFLACSSVANIAVDILFVAAFGMGVKGVAWATFICQGISCVLAVVFVFIRFSHIRTAGKVAVFSWHILGKISSIAIPSILQQSFVSVGNIIIQGIINPFGSSVIAGYAAAIKLNGFVIAILNTLGNGISNFTAQNIGAQKADRIKEGYRAGLKMTFFICGSAFLLYVFGGGFFIRLFLDSPSEEAVRTGVTFLRIVAPIYIVIALKLISDGVLKGAGMMKAFMAATFIDLFLRVVFAKLMSVPFGATGIWLAWPIGWVVSTVISFYFYKTERWKSMSILD